MAWEKLDHKEEGDRYLGTIADDGPIPTYDSVEENSIAEDLATGSLYKFHDGNWYWYDSVKELDHNRAMLGLGLSYKTWHKVVNVPDGSSAVYRFNPGEAAKFHHAEGRIWRAKGGDIDFEIYRGHNINNLPTIVDSLPKINQKGLDPNLSNSNLIFDYHGVETDANLAVLLADATLVDFDEFLIATGVGNTTNTAGSSLPSGRHYDPDTEYLILQKPANGAAVGYVYFYMWHEG